MRSSVGLIERRPPATGERVAIHPLNPVTLTAHRQLAAVWTMTCWLPVVVSGVTAWPDATVLLTAGLDPGLPPALTTKMAKVGEVAGAGVHWNAQPMFQVPPAMLNAALVQFPLCVVWGIKTVAGPVVWVAVVDDVEPAAVVVVVPPAAVVVVVPPEAPWVPVDPPWVPVEAGADPGGGSL